MATGTRVQEDCPPPSHGEVILDRLRDLETPPAATHEFFTRLLSGDLRPEDLLELLRGDPTLTYALERRADDDAGDAWTSDRAECVIDSLGVSAVREALCVRHTAAALPIDSLSDSRPLQTRLWNHALAAGAAAEMLAEGLAIAAPPGAALLCGLFLDCGMTALAAVLPKGYARVLARTARTGTSICDQERGVLGLSHTGAGRGILDHWRFPHAMAECAYWHHHDPRTFPSAVREPGLVRIVHVADQLVRDRRTGFSWLLHGDDAVALAASLGFSGELVKDVVGRLVTRVASLTGFDGARSDRPDFRVCRGQPRARVSRGTQARPPRIAAVRTACLEGVGGFAESPTTGTGRDLCAAAAEAIRTALRIDRVVVTAPLSADGHPDGHHCVAVSDRARGDGPPPILTFRDASPSRSLECTEAASDTAQLLLAGRFHETLWRWSGCDTASASLWTLPLIAGDRAVGAAIFPASKATVVELRAVESEMSTLSHVIGAALAQGIARDEANRLADELVDSQRRYQADQPQEVRRRSISSVAAMAAGAAHELNNPLAVISGRGQMGLAASRDAKTQETFKIIVEQAHRASAIVTDLMDFAKPPAPAPSEQPLTAVLESLCQHWQADSTLHDEQISSAAKDPAVRVYADPAQLKAILDAVVANAVEAMSPETARLQINSPSRASDEKVRIVISDNGVGMSADVLRHAVDPFYSHRPAGRGRGLGLARAHRLAEVNGGRLWLESTPGSGTTVTLELPARQPKVPPAAV